MALLGMAIAQGGALIKHFAEPSIQVTAESTGSEKFVAGMVGLACPECDQNYSALRSAAPVINFDNIREDNLQIEESYQEQELEPTSALVESNQFINNHSSQVIYQLKNNSKNGRVNFK